MQSVKIVLFSFLVLVILCSLGYLFVLSRCLQNEKQLNRNCTILPTKIKNKIINNPKLESFYHIPQKPDPTCGIAPNNVYKTQIENDFFRNRVNLLFGGSSVVCG